MKTIIDYQWLIILIFLSLCWNTVYTQTPSELFFARSKKHFYNEKLDSALLVLDSMERYTQENNLEEDYCFALCSRFLIHDFQRDFKAMALNAQKLEQVLIDSLAISVPLNLRTHLTLADYYDEIYEYDRSLNHYEQSLDVVDTTTAEIPQRHLSILYTNLSDLYLDYGQYKEAQLLIDKALLTIKMSNYRREDLAVIYTNLGRSYLPTDKNKSLEYFKKAKTLHLEENNLRDLTEFYKLHLTLADNYLALGQPKLGLIEVENLLSIIGKNNHEVGRIKIRAFTKLGEINRVMGRLDMASDYLETSIRLTQAIGVEGSHETKEAYYQMGILAGEAKDYDKALLLLDKAIAVEKDKERDVNTALASVKSPSFLFEIYYAKAKFFAFKSRDSSTLLDWKKAQAFYRLAMEVFDLLKNRMGEHASKTILFNQHYNFFEEAVSFNYEYWQKFREKTALEDMYFYMEKSKGNTRNTKFTNLHIAEGNRQLVDLLISLRTQNKAIVDLEKKKYNLLEDVDTIRKDSLVEAILSRKRIEQKTLAQIQKAFPKYYEMEFNTNIPSMVSVQQKLDRGQSLLSYFLSENHLYGLVIAKDSTFIHRLEVDSSFNELVETFREGILSVTISDLVLRAEKEDWYTKAANMLYGKIFLPFEACLSDRVIICPDGILTDIAFDALLTAYPTEKNYREYPYLIKKYNLSYDYSVEAFYSRRKTRVETINLLGVAPDFARDSLSPSILSPLLYNVHEINKIRHLFKGNSLIGGTASKKAFIEKVSQYNLVHLATHGIVDRAKPDYTYLAFSDVDSSEVKLYLKEIYNLDVEAEMVVLSACETGMGKHEKGEGAISLARGFSYAGAKSVVPSLWKISDGTVVRIMSNFYKELRAVGTKDIAMRKAKLAYIDASPHLAAHPFYWAAFVVIGDTGILLDEDKTYIEIIDDYKYILLICVFMFIFVRNLFGRNELV